MPLFDLIGPFMATLGILYLGGCLCIYSQQRRLIFVPRRELSGTPESCGLAYEDVWISESSAADEVRHGWWLPTNASRGTVLFLHGNSHNVSENLDQAARFNRLGFSVLLADYRGYGLSKGPFPNEQRVYEDAEAMWQYLTVQRGIDPGSILLYGHSLGGAIAIELATHHPSLGALVVESSFTSMADMARQKSSLALFPTRWILTQHFDSLSKVRSLTMPTLFIHGQRDDTVPYTMSQALCQAAQEPKSLLLDPNADHVDVADVMGPAYDRAILAIAHHLSQSAVSQ